MKKLFNVMLALMFLTACEPLSGLLTVSKELKVRDKKGNIKLIAPGQYDTIFEYDGYEKLKIEFKNAEKYKQKDIEIKPKVGKLDFPTDNGDFSISTGQLGQDWMMTGNITTVEDRSDKINSIERCYITRREQDCDTDEFGHTDCNWVDRQYPGIRGVVFYLVKKNSTITANFVEGNETLASVSKALHREERDYVFQDECIETNRR